MAANDKSPATIVIPAFNEANNIAGLLTALINPDLPVNTQVTVVCNGCTDNTADVARQAAATLAENFAHKITVLDLPEGSKVGAIRAAEAQLPQGPRLYLDADVLCSGKSAAALLAAVTATPGKLAELDVSVPQREFDFTGVRSLALRSYHRFWADLPWVRTQLAGRGAYALSVAQRQSFALFPQVVADDRWATTRPAAHRAGIVAEPVVIRPAATFVELLAARRRIFVGNAHPDLPTHDLPRADRIKGLLSAGMHPTRWLGLVTFLGVSSMAKRAARRDVAHKSVQWSTKQQHKPLTKSELR